MSKLNEIGKPSHTTLTVDGVLLGVLSVNGVDSEPTGGCRRVKVGSKKQKKA